MTSAHTMALKLTIDDCVITANFIRHLLKCFSAGTTLYLKLNKINDNQTIKKICKIAIKKGVAVVPIGNNVKNKKVAKIISKLEIKHKLLHEQYESNHNLKRKREDNDQDDYKS